MTDASFFELVVVDDDPGNLWSALNEVERRPLLHGWRTTLVHVDPWQNDGDRGVEDLRARVENVAGARFVPVNDAATAKAEVLRLSQLSQRRIYVIWDLQLVHAPSAPDQGLSTPVAKALGRELRRSGQLIVRSKTLQGANEGAGEDMVWGGREMDIAFDVLERLARTYTPPPLDTIVFAAASLHAALPRHERTRVPLAALIRREDGKRVGSRTSFDAFKVNYSELRAWLDGRSPHVLEAELFPKDGKGVRVRRTDGQLMVLWDNPRAFQARNLGRLVLAGLQPDNRRSDLNDELNATLQQDSTKNVVNQTRLTVRAQVGALGWFSPERIGLEDGHPFAAWFPGSMIDQ